MLKRTFFRIKMELFPRLVTSGEYISFLRNAGIKIGRGTIFYNAGSITIDASRPSLLKIGEYCKITSGVTILTHDYSRSVLRRVYGDIVGEANETVIGDNCFIGINSIILMGSKIGNNVIVGAGSVVTGSIPDNVVIAGNPARIVRTLQEHYSYRKDKSIEEAKWFANHFYNTYGRVPTIEEMDPFYPLFLERNLDKVRQNNLTIRLGGDNYEEVVSDFLKSKPIFEGYCAFLKECGLKCESSEDECC